jgi:sarcosine oxidase
MAAVDVAIVGLGAIGAAVAWQAAAQGLSVAGFDALAPPHQSGSTHGRSRIIREAYFEHPQYVPLVQRAYRLWADLETRARTRLFQATGGLMIGREDSVVIEGTRRAAREHGLAVQTWTLAEMASRVPPLRPSAGMIGVFEPRAGILAPERAVAAMLGAAQAEGAALHVNEPVAAWEPRGAAVEVRTATRRLTAGHLVLAAGPWLPGLLDGLPLPLTVERMVQHWYPSGDARFAPSAFPVFLLEAPDGRMLYGLPDQGHGVKLAEHHGGAATTAATVHRVVTDAERAAFHSWARAWVHGLPAAPAESRVCLYTNTPDGDFVLDWHPAAPGVFVCSACSGHGFKFAPAIGEAVATQLRGGESRLDLTPFRVARLL